MNVITDGLWVTSPLDSDYSKSPTAIEYSKYNSLASPDHIRLLRILPGNSEPLAVTLEEVDLEKTSYECLSYTWDGPKYDDIGEEWTTNHKVIACNNVVLNIRQNLYDVLIHMRQLSMLGPVWIDALCINQEDKQERQDQVGLMSRIYKGCKRVIVWLGKEDEHTALALEHLKRSKVTPAGVYEDSGFDTKMYHEAAFTDEEYDSIFCFLSHRRWFSRLWTIQETVLARELIFLCGKYEATLQTIYAGASALRYRNARAGLNPDYEKISDQAEWAVMLFVVANRRHEWQEEDVELESIGANALSFANCQATDLRDKVFGLIGISRCTDEYLEEELVADYDASVHDIFIKAGKFAMLSATDLDALSRAQDIETKEVNGLPSWVADLSVEEMDYFESEESYLKASSHFKTFTLDFEDNVLVLAASQFDRITAIGETFDTIQDVGLIQDFLQVFLDVGPTYKHTGEEMTVAMRRVLIADRLDLDAQDEVAMMDKEYDMHDAFEKWLCRLICYALRTDPEGSDSESESGSESGDENGSNADSESESDGVLIDATSTSDADVPKLKTQKDGLQAAGLTNSVEPTDIIQSTTSGSTVAKVEEPDDGASAASDSTDAKKAATAARKAVRSSLLATFLASPSTALHDSMDALGFPDPSVYALLEPSILRGAAACNHKPYDFEIIVDELFESMWCGNDQFASSWFYKARNKVPFRTEKGFIGLGVETLKVGDQVFFVEGASAMYALRERTVSVDDINGEDDAASVSGSVDAVKLSDGEQTDMKDPEVKMEVPVISPIEGPGISADKAIPSNKASPGQTQTSKSTSESGKQKKIEDEEADEDDWISGADTESNSGSSSGSTSSGKSYEDGGEYTLAGEVYMHGIMYGEMFEDGKGEDIIFKKVRIH